jgi:hypothetical protein
VIPMHSMIEMIQGTVDLTFNKEKLPMQLDDDFEEINAKVWIEEIGFASGNLKFMIE